MIFFCIISLTVKLLAIGRTRKYSLNNTRFADAIAAHLSIGELVLGQDMVSKSSDEVEKAGIRNGTQRFGNEVAGG